MKEEEFGKLRDYYGHLRQFDERVTTEILVEAKDPQSADWAVMEFAKAHGELTREQGGKPPMLSSAQSTKLTSGMQQMRFIKSEQGQYLLAITPKAIELFTFDRYIDPDGEEFEATYGTPFELGNSYQMEVVRRKLWAVDYTGLAMFDETFGRDDAVVVFTEGSRCYWRFPIT